MSKTIKLDQWPRMLPNDDGLRPAGGADKCFYCNATIGQWHGKECVTVCKLVEYRVLIEGKAVGTYARQDPHFWTGHDCDFHKNHSSWCANNALDEIKWLDEEAAIKQLEKDAEHDSCCCNLLEFQFVKVVDEGPFIEIREEMPT